MIEKSMNQYSSNIIAIVKNTKAHTKALDKALQKHIPKHIPKHSQSTYQSTYQSTVSINKQLNKEYIYNEFYDLEIENNSECEKIEDYKKIVTFIFGNNVSKIKLDGVLKIKNQIKYSEFISLMNVIDIETLKLNLYSIQNNKAYQKRESLYLSFLNWAKRKR